MSWQVRITSQTHDQSGKRRSWTRTVDLHSGQFPVLSPSTIPAFIEQNLPALFHGCEVRVLTALHHFGGIVDPDTQRFTYGVRRYVDGVRIPSAS